MNGLGFPNLRQLRINLKMTQEDFAKSLGISKTTYNNYETGTREPRSDFWEKVSKKYGVTVDFLLGISNENISRPIKTEINALNEQELEHIKKYRSLTDRGRKAVDAVTEVLYEAEDIKYVSDNVIHINVRRLPLYEVGASAGDGNPLDDSPYEIVEVGPEAPLQTSFLLKADGDSMEPLIQDGETLYIRQQNRVEDGDIGIFWYDGCVYVKKQEHRSDELYLISLNPKYNPIKIIDESIHCFGKVLNK